MRGPWVWRVMLVVKCVALGDNWFTLSNYLKYYPSMPPLRHLQQIQTKICRRTWFTEHRIL